MNQSKNVYQWGREVFFFSTFVASPHLGSSKNLNSLWFYPQQFFVCAYRFFLSYTCRESPVRHIHIFNLPSFFRLPLAKKAQTIWHIVNRTSFGSMKKKHQTTIITIILLKYFVPGIITIIGRHNQIREREKNTITKNQRAAAAAAVHVTFPLSWLQIKTQQQQQTCFEAKVIWK